MPTRHIEANPLLAVKALWLRGDRPVHTKESAMARWWAPEVSLRTIHRSLLIHGHMGYSEGLPKVRRLREVINFELGNGTLLTLGIRHI